jgi:GTP-dependent phosphoenolpyruvate carboxykinase
MLGKKVELIRYKVTWQEDEQEMQENCISEEHKNEIEQMLTDKEITFTTEVIDQTGNEWFDGLEFDSYDRALEVFNKGEQAYLQEKQRQELTDNLRLRADIDYLAIMSGVEI